MKKGGKALIKHLSGEYEAIEYTENNVVMLYDNNEDENYPVHWHNAVEMIMPLQNGFTVCADNKVYELGERDFILIPSGELHSLNAPKNGRRLILQFDSAMISDSPALSVLSPVFSEIFLINSRADKELGSCVKKIMLDIYDEYFSDDELSKVKIYLKILNLVMAIREAQLIGYEEKLNKVYQKSPEYSQKFALVYKYIDQNYMYDISLDKLSAIAGYSKYHFCRIFRQFSSVSYIDYINLKRAKAAEKLLLEPDIPITEVAMRSRFLSLTSFNRIFKEMKHCTPSEFRKMYKDSFIV